MREPKPGFRVQEIHAFLCVGEENEEGVAAFLAPSGMWMPLIASDPERLALLRPHAEAIAKASGRPVRLVRFSVREDLEVIT